MLTKALLTRNLFQRIRNFLLKEGEANRAANSAMCRARSSNSGRVLCRGRTHDVGGGTNPTSMSQTAMATQCK